jgi:hypothetical protein
VIEKSSQYISICQLSGYVVAQKLIDGTIEMSVILPIDFSEITLIDRQAIPEISEQIHRLQFFYGYHQCAKLIDPYFFWSISRYRGCATTIPAVPFPVSS